MAEDLPTALRKDDWLTDVLQRPAYLCQPTSASDLTVLKRKANEIQADVHFIYGKVACADVKTIEIMSQLDLRLVDTNVTFEGPLNPSSCEKHNAIHCRFANPNDRAQVEELAVANFTHSRFHLDPHVPDELANHLKQCWAGNFFRGERGDHLVVALSGEQIVGFCQVLARAEIAVIDLIAVDASVRRQGVAVNMLSYLARACPQYTVVRSGTQVANTASVRLYEQFGMRLVSASYLFHSYR